MTVVEPISSVDTQKDGPIQETVGTSEEVANVEERNETSTVPQTSVPSQQVTEISSVQTDNLSVIEELTHQKEELIRQLAETAKKAENYREGLLRKQAEYENLQKRTSREIDHTRKYALEKFATELLTVKDSLEMGWEATKKPETHLDTVREGMVLTLKMLTDTLTKFDITEINPIEQKFNPQWHEAMATHSVPHVEEGMIIHVHQKGYQLHDRLLRPARVVVAKAAPIEKPLEN